MKEMVFLVEGEAERNLLNSLMPRLLPQGMGHRVIPFQGKQDMEKRMVMKIRGYQNVSARFIVLRDQDSHTDCIALKQSLMARCVDTGKGPHCLVRIACTELESFYLADLAAAAKAWNLPQLVRYQAGKKFRNPDHLGNPKQELKALTGNRYEERAGSSAIGPYLDLDNARSPSFHHLVKGIRCLISDLLKA